MTTAKLPRAVWGIASPWRVEVVRAFEGEREGRVVLGQTHLTERVIQLRRDLAPVTLRATFWHEFVHTVLYDSGASNGLHHEQEEAICDALGSAFAAAVKGWPTGRR